MLDRTYGRRVLLRYRILGLTVVLLAVTATVSARAADQAESRIVLASRYSGTDLNDWRLAWPPRGAPRTGVVQPLPKVDEDVAPIPTTPARAAATAVAGDLQSAQNSGPDQTKLAGILSEVRVGVLGHDVGLFGRSREDGVDVSVEVFFVSPKLFEAIWSPRPHIGFAANTAGDTSQIYGGLSWDWTFWEPFFVEGALALAVHDGELNEKKADRKALGCRVLFRESVSLGARFLEQHTISLQLAHISNANLCDKNGGLDTIGIQYGYRF